MQKTNRWKSTAFRVFQTLAFLVLLAMVLSLVIDPGPSVKRWLKAVMFALIGIGYLTAATAFDRLLLRVVIAGCGLFLLVSSLLPQTTAVYGVGLGCLLLPLLMARTTSKKEISATAPHPTQHT